MGEWEPYRGRKHPPETRLCTKLPSCEGSACGTNSPKQSSGGRQPGAAPGGGEALGWGWRVPMAPHLEAEMALENLGGWGVSPAWCVHFYSILSNLIKKFACSPQIRAKQRCMDSNGYKLTSRGAAAGVFNGRRQVGDKCSPALEIDGRQITSAGKLSCSERLTDRIYRVLPAHPTECLCAAHRVIFHFCISDEYGILWRGLWLQSCPVERHCSVAVGRLGFLSLLSRYPWPCLDGRSGLYKAKQLGN